MHPFTTPFDKVRPITWVKQVIGVTVRWTAGASKAEPVNKRVTSHRFVLQTRTVEWALSPNLARVSHEYNENTE